MTYIPDIGFDQGAVGVFVMILMSAALIIDEHVIDSSLEEPKQILSLGLVVEMEIRVGKFVDFRRVDSVLSLHQNHDLCFGSDVPEIRDNLRAYHKFEFRIPTNQL